VNGNGHTGTGLGLSIARQVVESHGGRLVVFSALGVGSTFVIWLRDRAVAWENKGRELEPSKGDPPDSRAVSEPSVNR